MEFIAIVNNEILPILGSNLFGRLVAYLYPSFFFIISSQKSQDMALQLNILGDYDENEAANS